MTMKMLVGLLMVAAPIFGAGRWTHGPKDLIPKEIHPRYAAGAPLFDHRLRRDQFGQLLTDLDGYRQKGHRGKKARVVRVQILSTPEEPVVQVLRPGEARPLPPGESVTLWGEYGRGPNNRNDLTRLRVRYSVVDDQHPQAQFSTTHDARLTRKGWVVNFRGIEASNWNYGEVGDMRGSSRSPYSLPRNPWDAQIRASSVLRYAVEYAGRVLHSRALEVPLIR